MKVVTVLAAFLALASALPSSSHKSQFEAFEKQFGKSYKDSSERLTRFAIFSQNLKEIENHNRLRGSSWTKTVNQFADMTHEEFNQAMNGYINAPKPGMAFAKVKDAVKVEDLPASWDWRDKGAISDVKDQGYCGSCWAFATSKHFNNQYQPIGRSSFISKWFSLNLLFSMEIMAKLQRSLIYQAKKISYKFSIVSRVVVLSKLLVT